MIEPNFLEIQTPISGNPPFYEHGLRCDTWVHTTEKLVRFCKLIDRATGVFGDKYNGIQWLKALNPYIGGDAPISYLNNNDETNIVFDMLGRIEHGVFS